MLSRVFVKNLENHFEFSQIYPKLYLNFKNTQSVSIPRLKSAVQKPQNLRLLNMKNSCLNNIITFGRASKTIDMMAASPYCL